MSAITSSVSGGEVALSCAHGRSLMLHHHLLLRSRTGTKKAEGSVLTKSSHARRTGWIATLVPGVSFARPVVPRKSNGREQATGRTELSVCYFEFFFS